MFIAWRSDLSDDIGRATKKAKHNSLPVYVIPYDPAELQTAPERRLIVAVLLRGLRDICEPVINPSASKYDIEWRQLEREEAIQWLHSDSIDPFSFLWCCGALGFNQYTIDTIRRRSPFLNKRQLEIIYI